MHEALVLHGLEPLTLSCEAVKFLRELKPRRGAVMQAGDGADGGGGADEGNSGAVDDGGADTKQWGRADEASNARGSADADSEAKRGAADVPNSGAGAARRLRADKLETPVRDKSDFTGALEEGGCDTIFYVATEMDAFITTARDTLFTVRRRGRQS